MYTIFVYGTLTDRDVAGSVLDQFEYTGRATLEGLHRVDGEYPTLAPGGTADGKLLATQDLDSLDRYEGVDRGLYVRVTVPLSDGDHVQTYVGHPQRLGAPDEWPGNGSFADRVTAYLAENEVIVRPTTGSPPDDSDFEE